VKQQSFQGHREEEGGHAENLLVVFGYQYGFWLPVRMIGDAILLIASEKNKICKGNFALHIND